jgi:hypothetical protein
MSEVASGSFEWPAWRKGCKAANSILYTRIWKKAVSKRPFLVWKGCMKRPKELILSSISYRSQGIIKFRSLLNIESVLPQKFASMIWGFESDTCESMQKMRLLWSLGQEYAFHRKEWNSLRNFLNLLWKSVHHLFEYFELYRGVTLAPINSGKRYGLQGRRGRHSNAPKQQ